MLKGKRAAYGVIGLLLAGPALSLAADREAWPFCAYQMFSGARNDDSLVRLRLFGVTAEAPPREIPLVAPEFIAPFDSARLNRDTIMPSYYRVDGLNQVAAAWRGKPVLTVQQVEDTVAYLLTLR